MPNIHGLHSLRNNSNNAAAGHNRDDDDDNSDDDEGNDRYVGGVDSRGGGSGLAVVPNRENNDRRRHRAAAASSDAIFNLAESDTAATAGSAAAAARGSSTGGGAHHRTIITMYRSGFTVDDGPYRRLDDPANSEFLTSMARGHVPRELREQAAALRKNNGGGEGNNNDDQVVVPEVMVGLVDRRSEEYDPDRHGGGRDSSETNTGFQSFSGEGQSLGGVSSTTATSSSSSGSVGGGGTGGGIIDPSQSSNTTPPPPLDPNAPSTSIAIRLLNGSRLVIKVNTSSPVSEIGQHIGSQAGSQPYVLTSGYPPRVVEDLNVSIEEAGLKGSQVVLKAV